MQSGSGLDGCYRQTDATCKTVTNKGISFLMWFSDPTPLHMALIIHRLHTQRASGESNSLSPYLGCTLFSQFSASTKSSALSSQIESFNVRGPSAHGSRSAINRNPRHFCRQVVFTGPQLVFPSVMPMRVASTHLSYWLSLSKKLVRTQSYGGVSNPTIPGCFSVAFPLMLS